jgi:hypothetical protein
MKTISLSVLCAALSVSTQVASAQGYAAADMRKAMVELPTAKLLKSSDFLSNVAPKKDSSDERTPPGIVAWHSNYDEAVRAAQTSGKPVLLFQLMGNLDEKFC